MHSQRSPIPEDVDLLRYEKLGDELNSRNRRSPGKGVAQRKVVQIVIYETGLIYELTERESTL